MVTDAVGWFWGLDTSIDTAGRCGKNFTQGNLCTGDVLGRQGLEVGAHETAKQGRPNIVRVTLFGTLDV